MNKIIYEVRQILQEMKQCDVSSYSASAAFFLVLSLVPMLLLICGIIPYTNISMEVLIQFLVDIFPGSMAQLCTMILVETQNRHLALLSISAVITLWAAGKGIFALMKGMNRIYHVNEQRNFVTLRILASIYLIGEIVTLLLSLGLLVFGNQVTDFILHSFPGLKPIYSVLLHFRFILFWAGYIFMFMSIYCFLPNKKTSFRSAFPGAVIASACWSLFSWVFSWYIDVFDGFSMYGSLTTIIVTMFWLYFCNYIVLLGAIFNVHYDEYKRNLKKKKP